MAQLLLIEEVRLKSTRRCGYSQSPHAQEASIQLVSCPAPSLEEEGSGDTQGFSWAEWNAISADMGWVFITR